MHVCMCDPRAQIQYTLPPQFKLNWAGKFVESRVAVSHCRVFCFVYSFLKARKPAHNSTAKYIYRNVWHGKEQMFVSYSISFQMFLSFLYSAPHKVLDCTQQHPTSADHRSDTINHQPGRQNVKKSHPTPTYRDLFLALGGVKRHTHAIANHTEQKPLVFSRRTWSA